jgi:hypothetical protein
MFVDAARGDLRLAGGARRAIDRGVDLRADEPDDIALIARDDTPDLGAHEHPHPGEGPAR